MSGTETEQLKVDLTANDFAFIGSNIWFIANELPYLICADIMTGEIKKKIFLDVNSGAYRDFYFKIVNLGNSIVGIPYWAEKYLFYDIIKGTIDYFDVPKNLIDDKGLGFYATMQINSSKFCSFNRYYKSYVLNLDIDTREVYARFISDSLCPDENVEQYGGFRRASVKSNDCFYVLSVNKNHVLQYNLTTEEMKSFPLLQESDRFTSIECIDEQKDLFILSNNSRQFVLWDMKANKTKVIPIDVAGFEDDLQNNAEVFHESFAFGKKIYNKVYFFPVLANMILEFDINNFKIKEVFNSAKYEYKKLL